MAKCHLKIATVPVNNEFLKAQIHHAQNIDNAAYYATSDSETEEEDLSDNISSSDDELEIHGGVIKPEEKKSTK